MSREEAEKKRGFDPQQPGPFGNPSLIDRGLVSIEDDFSVFIAKTRLPDTALRLLNENRRLILLQRADLLPYRHYPGYHRDNIFKI